MTDTRPIELCACCGYTHGLVRAFAGNGAPPRVTECDRCGCWTFRNADGTLDARTHGKESCGFVGARS